MGHKEITFLKCILWSKNKKKMLQKLNLLQCLMGGPRVASYIHAQRSIFLLRVDEKCCLWLLNFRVITNNISTPNDRICKLKLARFANKLGSHCGWNNDYNNFANERYTLWGTDAAALTVLGNFSFEFKYFDPFWQIFIPIKIFCFNTSAKVRSARGASCQPKVMVNCPTL